MAKQSVKAGAGTRGEVPADNYIDSSVPKSGELEVGGPPVDDRADPSQPLPPPPLPTVFDPNAEYDVQLSKAVDILGRTYGPAHRLRIGGGIAEEIRDSIYDAIQAN